MDIAEEIRNILLRYQSSNSPQQNDLAMPLQPAQATGPAINTSGTPAVPGFNSMSYQNNLTGQNRAGETINAIASTSTGAPRMFPTQTEVTERLRENFRPYSLAGRSRSLPSTATSSNSLVNEMRDNQQQRTPIPGASRVRASRVANRPPPKWTVSLVFLGEPNESRCPSAERHRQLCDGRLGKTHVTCDLEATAAALKSAIMDVFARESSMNYLQQFSSPSFGFSLASLRGSGSRDLSFSRSDASPKELKSLGVKVLYARPTLVLIEMDLGNEVSDTEDIAEDNNSTVAANQIASSSHSTNSLFHNFTMPTRTNEVVNCDGPGGFALDMSTYSDLDALRGLLRVLHQGHQMLQVPQLGLQLLPLTLLNDVGQLNVDQSVRVFIASENTFDAGGPMRSFLWKMMCAIRDGRYNGVAVLHGSGKALTISSDRCLKYDNVMYNLGRFFAFAILNVGYGFFGLNKLVVKIICNTWWPSAQDISLHDIPDHDAKNAAGILQVGVNQGISTWTADQRLQVRAFLQEKSWGFEVTSENVKDALDFVKLESFCDCRQQSLLEVRRGFLTTDTGRWVQSHPEYQNSLFPETFPLDVSFSELEASITGLEDHPQLLCMFRMYFEGFANDDKKISKFVEAVTGLPYLGERRIRIIVEEGPCLFTCRTCSYEFYMFETSSLEVFTTNMDIFLANCAVGFTIL